MSSVAQASRQGSARSHARERAVRRARQAERESLRGRASGVAEGALSHPKLLIFLIAIVAVVGMLYRPTRDYYVARRTSEDLAAYNAALQAQNDELSDDIQKLQTREGIEDEARGRGLVYPNETSVVVEGLVEPVATPLPEVEITDERPWYVKSLDFIFGYEFGVWQ